jgi:NAD(P)-dependent dehydrogenase (short-subunit alcohol dehydrogenase family)
MEIRFDDETALVTGAGQGMGRAIAETLAAGGADVVLNDIVENRIDEVESTLNDAHGGDALAVAADVTDYEAVQGMVETATASFGTVDILVNNAGAWVTAFFTQSTPEDWVKDIDLNLYGVLNCTHAVLPGMIDQEHGSIVNIVSDAGRVGQPQSAAYSAAKAGVEAFSKTIAKESGRYNVRSNCVSMGVTETSLTEDLLEGETREQVLSQYPISRAGRPQDAANAVCFLASDCASWVTGQTYPVNGGFTTC